MGKYIGWWKKKKTLSQLYLTLITCDLGYEIKIISQKEKQNKS